ncbi:MAG: TrpB-like pyridoxal-phosphate dependent enzyme, partial [Deltaproteobacteria bacterium RBG_19FT_COMBO_60_16]
LPDSSIPSTWYNALADLKNPPAPVIHPGTGKPVGPGDLLPLFPMGLIEQEVSSQRFIPIPQEVRERYAMWRPTPLFRAFRLEKAIGTRSKIYYKNEGVSAGGSHKLNTSIPQAFYNKQFGRKRIATETGAGQWGSAMAIAGSFFGIEVKVYMVKVSYVQKPYRRMLMEVFGAKVVPSPSRDTASGRSILAGNPDSPGSLGIAISEAVEDAAGREDTSYALGSVLNHVLLHQTVIGLEAKEQMAIAGDYPDVVIGCHGGGSNFSGIALPFLQDKLSGGKRNLRLVAAEPTSCPTLTKGVYAFDFGDTAKLTPIVKMYTLGHDFIPEGIHAGGLRYHGAAPLVSQLLSEGLVEAQAYAQLQVFSSSITFAKAEGVLPAPESGHAIHAAIAEAKKADAEGVERVILFNLSGHGFFDLAAYDDFLTGKLADHEHSEEKVREALGNLPKVAG